MKKLLTCLLVMFLALALVSCEKGEKKTYKLAFDTDGGTSVATVELEQGAAVNAPTAPTKEGYTFGGWYKDIDLLEEYTFPGRMPGSALTLYAKWVVTLTFDSKGGSSVEAIVGEPGSVFMMPKDPTFGNYVFIGWFYDDETKLTYVMPRQNATVHAKWQVFESGSAIVLDNPWLINDEGSYAISEVEEGTKITALSGKGEWSYVYQVIDGNAKANTTVVAVLEGKEGTTAVLKVEGGNAEQAAETAVEFTGELQKVVWTVEAKNLTSIGGQKFLIFVNGGTVGASEEAEYVIVKSLGLYRTIEEGAEQKATLTFMANGGSEVEQYYLPAGTKIEAPADPVKEGFIFTGWYKDKELTELYEFDEMPQTATIVYAGWKSENEYLADCNLMGGTFVALDEGMYEIQNNEASYVLKKTASGGEWNCMVLSMAGKKLTGYNLLRVELVGPKGEEIMFKINDANAGERKIVATGAKQIVELSFDFDLDPSKSLVVFVKPGVAGASGEFTITRLEYANYSRYFNALQDGSAFYDNDGTGTYTFAFEDGALEFSKSTEEGKEWSVLCVKYDVNLTGFDQLKAKVQGPAGEQMIIKINDQGGALEKWVTTNGEIQEVVIDIPTSFEHNSLTHTIVLFANPGAIGSGNTFKLYQLDFFRDEEATSEPTEPEEPAVSEPKMVDLMGGVIAALDENTYEIENNADSYVLKKLETAGEWSCMILPMAGFDLEGLNLLRVELTGPNGAEIMFKINDANIGERKVTTNGEKQFFEFSFDFALDSSKSLVIFLKPGKAEASDEFTITRLEYANYSEQIDLLKETFTQDNTGHTFSLEDGKLTLSKQGNEWDCIYVDAKSEVEGLKVRGLAIDVKGPAGEQLLLKLNDNGAFEKWVTTTGEVQHLEFTLNGELNGTSKFFVLFANPGQAGTTNEFEITSLVLYLSFAD